MAKYRQMRLIFFHEEPDVLKRVEAPPQAEALSVPSTSAQAAAFGFGSTTSTRLFTPEQLRNINEILTEATRNIAAHYPELFRDQE